MPKESKRIIVDVFKRTGKWYTRELFQYNDVSVNTPDYKLFEWVLNQLGSRYAGMYKVMFVCGDDPIPKLFMPTE